MEYKLKYNAELSRSPKIKEMIINLRNRTLAQMHGDEELTDELIGIFEDFFINSSLSSKANIATKQNADVIFEGLSKIDSIRYAYPAQKQTHPEFTPLALEAPDEFASEIRTASSLGEPIDALDREYLKMAEKIYDRQIAADDKRDAEERLQKRREQYAREAEEDEEDYSKRIIYLDPKLKADDRRLALYRAFAKAIISPNQEKLHRSLTSPIMSMPTAPFKPGATQYADSTLITGIQLIEDAIVEDIALRCFHSTLGTERPAAQEMTDPKVLDGRIFKSDFKANQIFQPLAISFAKASKSVPTKPNQKDSEVLKTLISAYLDPEFPKTLTAEAQKDSNLRARLKNLSIIRDKKTNNISREYSIATVLSAYNSALAVPKEHSTDDDEPSH